MPSAGRTKSSKMGTAAGWMALMVCFPGVAGGKGGESLG